MTSSPSPAARRLLVAVAAPVLLAGPAPAQQRPAPSPAQISDAGEQAARQLAQLLAIPAEGDPIDRIESIARRAGEFEDPALEVALMRAARDAAVARSDPARAMLVVDRLLQNHALWPVDEQLRLLDACAQMPECELATHLDLVLRVCARFLADGRHDRHVASALENGREALPAHAEPVLRAWFSRRATALEEAVEVRRSYSDDDAARQRFRALFLEDAAPPLDAWAASEFADAGLAQLLATPLPPILEDPALAQDEREARQLEHLSRGAQLLRAAGRHATWLPRRHLLVRARRITAACWPTLEEPHRTRAVQTLDRIDDQLAALDTWGTVGFDTDADLDRMLFHDRGDHGEWWLESGVLRGMNRWTRSTATLRASWEEIASVRILARIESRAGLNLRIAVGDVNLLCNWEQEPANVVWLGDTEHRIPGPWLGRGSWHDIRLRQLGDELLLTVDDTVVFRDRHTLAGTLTVYPAYGSVIAVDSIQVVGRLDPGATVTGPSGPAR